MRANTLPHTPHLTTPHHTTVHTQGEDAGSEWIGDAPASLESQLHGLAQQQQQQQQQAMPMAGATGAGLWPSAGSGPGSAQQPQPQPPQQDLIGLQSLLPDVDERTMLLYMLATQWQQRADAPAASLMDTLLGGSSAAATEPLLSAASGHSPGSSVSGHGMLAPDASDTAALLLLLSGDGDGAASSTFDGSGLQQWPASMPAGSGNMFHGPLGAHVGTSAHSASHESMALTQAQVALFLLVFRPPLPTLPPFRC